jgi:hypothetical protein
MHEKKLEVDKKKIKKLIIKILSNLNQLMLPIHMKSFQIIKKLMGNDVINNQNVEQF